MTGFVSFGGNKLKEFEIPDGWYRVFSGPIKPGDQFLSMLLAEDDITHWRDADVPSLEDVRTHQPYSSAEWYGMLIRKGEPVEKACKRCLIRGCALGFVLCRQCRRESIRSRP